METNEVNIQISNTAKIARIETLVEDMHLRLFGNGQPGVVQVYDKRLDSLEHDRAKIKGSFAVVSVLLAMVGWPHIRNLFWR